MTDPERYAYARRAGRRYEIADRIRHIALGGAYVAASGIVSEVAVVEKLQLAPSDDLLNALMAGMAAFMIASRTAIAAKAYQKELDFRCQVKTGYLASEEIPETALSTDSEL
jgi:hypothetical protein